MHHVAVSMLCSSWLLFTVTIPLTEASALSILQRRSYKGEACTRPAELSSLVKRYVNRALNVLDRIHFSNPSFKQEFLRRPELKRNLLLWDFRKLDGNKNGILDSSESGLLAQACGKRLFNDCDLDGSRGISLSEWLSCLVEREPTRTKCSFTPQANIVELPPGCVDPNTNKPSMDLGTCPTDVCQKPGVSEKCNGSAVRCCCRAAKVSKVPLRCTDTFNATMDRVEKCDCTVCDTIKTLAKR